MSNKRILVLVLTLVVFALLTAPIKRSEAHTTLDVGLYCISLGHQRLECHFEVSGGTGIYSYQFSPQATRIAEDVGIAIVPCGPPCTLEYVTLYVTDSNNNTGNASAWGYCGDAD
jgi:hypothetical protein